MPTKITQPKAAAARQLKPKGTTRPSSGRAVTSNKLNGTALHHRPSHYPIFLFKSHPHRWQVMDGELLPALAEIRIVPGVNGVDHNGRYSLAKARAEDEGWTVIPYEVVEGGYVRAHETIWQDDKGKPLDAHLSRWQEPYMSGGRPAVRLDTKGYREFLRFLVSEAIIPLPAPDLLERMDEMVRDRLAKLLDKHGTVSKQKQLTADQQIDAIRVRREQVFAAMELEEEGEPAYTGPRHVVEGGRKVVEPDQHGAPGVAGDEGGSE